MSRRVARHFEWESAERRTWRIDKMEGRRTWVVRLLKRPISGSCRIFPSARPKKENWYWKEKGSAPTRYATPNMQRFYMGQIPGSAYLEDLNRIVS